jgi:precorrin-2 dehydrogenase/sirohydrochlorin ferrochelatase
LTPPGEQILNLLPMFLKVAGRSCLVVGAGAEGESKIAHLLEAGAKVEVVSPEATGTVRAWAHSKKIKWRPRRYRPSDLKAVYLVVAATSSPKTQREIFREAKRRAILCNVADVPRFCDFYFPAVVRRGPLVIAISTSGQSPALAQRLRKQLELQFGKEYERWIKHLGKARKKLLTRTMDLNKRKTLLHQIASQQAFESYVRKQAAPGKRQKSRQLQSKRKLRAKK